MPSETIAITTALASHRMAKMQLRFMRRQMVIAEGYLAVFKLQRQFYRETFRPRTEDILRLLAVDPLFTPNYRARYGYANSLGVFNSIYDYEIINFNSASSLQTAYYDRRGQMYSLPKPTNTQMLLYRDAYLAQIGVDVANHLYRYEEYKENIWGQRRYDRFMVVGEYSNKNAIAMSRDGAASFGALSDAIEAKANMYGAAANDLFAASGNAWQAGGRSVKNSMGFPEINTIQKTDTSRAVGSRAISPMQSYSIEQAHKVTLPYANTVTGGRMVK